MTRPIGNGRRVLLHLEPGISADGPGHIPEQTLEPLGIVRGTSNLYGYSSTTLGELDAITASEILRDLTTLTTP